MATSSIMLTLVLGIATCNLCAARRVKTLGSRQNELGQERKEELSLSKDLQKDPNELADLIQKFEMDRVVVQYNDRERVEDILAEREGGAFAEIIQRAPGLIPEITAFDKEGVEISKEEFETLDKNRFPVVLKSKLQEAQRLESEEKEKEEEERSVSKGSFLEYSIRNENNLTGSSQGIDPATLATIIQLGGHGITQAQAYKSYNVSAGKAMDISVRPKGLTSWSQMTGWTLKTSDKFTIFHFVNVWDVTLVHVWCTPDFYYGGRYHGTGRYLDNVQVRCSVSSMFGWSAYQKVRVERVVNKGNLSNPIAELPLVLETRAYCYGIERHLKKTKLLFRGDGTFQRTSL